MATVKSYKIPSKATNLIVFLAGFIVYIGRDGLLQILPESLAYIAPIIVMVAGYIAVQTTENKRVEHAEQLAVQNIQEEEIIHKDEPATEPEEEDIEEAGEEDGC